MAVEEAAGVAAVVMAVEDTAEATEVEVVDMVVVTATAATAVDPTAIATRMVTLAEETALGGEGLPSHCSDIHEFTQQSNQIAISFFNDSFSASTMSGVDSGRSSDGSSLKGTQIKGLDESVRAAHSADS